MLKRHVLLAAVAVTLSAATGSLVQAEDVKTIELSIKDAAFTPAEIKVPAGQAFVIKFKNNNAAPVELEAKDLKIEKIAAGNSEIVVRVKAMPAGKYLFVDEFQEDVAKGYVVVE